MSEPNNFNTYLLEVDTFGEKNYRETLRARNDKEIRGFILSIIVDVFEIYHLGHIKEVRLWKKIATKLKKPKIVGGK